jgi:pimeloyl-ACP methyl ester carboxylesterase
MAIDRTIELEINGSKQKIRLCAEQAGLAPILIVQAGLGLPLLHEIRKFQRHLRLESNFLAGYWEQRGCGDASEEDAKSVSLRQQVEDLRAVLKWLQIETRQSAVLLGISLGGTIALQAAEQEAEKVKAVIAISPDAETALSDAAANLFLKERCALVGDSKLSNRLKKLGEPPYTNPSAFQKRAALLTDLGGIERGKKFNALVRETLFSMIRTYGVIGAIKALRNLNLIQKKLLPELVTLDLFAKPPRLAVPVHYIFGVQDPLTPEAIVERLPAAICPPSGSVTVAPDAGHMVHFDQPELVRSIAMRARDAARA